MNDDDAPTMKAFTQSDRRDAATKTAPPPPANPRASAAVAATNLVKVKEKTTVAAAGAAAADVVAEAEDVARTAEPSGPTRLRASAETPSPAMSPAAHPTPVIPPFAVTTLGNSAIPGVPTAALMSGQATR